MGKGPAFFCKPRTVLRFDILNPVHCSNPAHSLPRRSCTLLSLTCLKDKTVARQKFQLMTELSVAPTTRQGLYRENARAPETIQQGLTFEQQNRVDTTHLRNKAEWARYAPKRLAGSGRSRNVPWSHWLLFEPGPNIAAMDINAADAIQAGTCSLTQLAALHLAMRLLRRRMYVVQQGIAGPTN